MSVLLGFCGIMAALVSTIIGYNLSNWVRGRDMRGQIAYRGRGPIMIEQIRKASAMSAIAALKRAVVAKSSPAGQN